jgi:hypothetical protein
MKVPRKIPRDCQVMFFNSQPPYYLHKGWELFKEHYYCWQSSTGKFLNNSSSKRKITK